jgi:hypothetical protein
MRGLSDVKAGNMSNQQTGTAFIAVSTERSTSARAAARGHLDGTRQPRVEYRPHGRTAAIHPPYGRPDDQPDITSSSVQRLPILPMRAPATTAGRLRRGKPSDAVAHREGQKQASIPCGAALVHSRLAGEPESGRYVNSDTRMTASAFSWNPTSPQI